jgi:hypothetical protein
MPPTLLTQRRNRVGRDTHSSASVDGYIHAPSIGRRAAVSWPGACRGLLLKSYRDLNSAKFEIILAMEERLPARVYGDEWNRLRREQQHVPDRLLPEGDTKPLFRLYALLALTKGRSVTAEDVHNAWAAWMLDQVRTTTRSSPSMRLMPRRKPLMPLRQGDQGGC